MSCLTHLVSPLHLLILPNAPLRLSDEPHALLQPCPDYKKEKQYTKKKVTCTFSRFLTAMTAYFPFFSKSTANFPLSKPTLPSTLNLMSMKEGGEGCSACLLHSSMVSLKPLASVTGHKNKRFLRVSRTLPAWARGQTVPYPSKLSSISYFLAHRSWKGTILPQTCGMCCLSHAFLT